jgi:hypothetical protein
VARVRFPLEAPGPRCSPLSVFDERRRARLPSAGNPKVGRQPSKLNCESSSLSIRSHAGEAARCGSALPMRSRRVRFSSPAPSARCSGSDTVCKIVERGSTPRRASNAPADGSAQRLLNAGAQARHLPGVLRRIRLVAQDAGFSIRRRGFDSLMRRHISTHGGQQVYEASSGGSTPPGDASASRPQRPRAAEPPSLRLRSRLARGRGTTRPISLSSDDRGIPNAAYRVRLPAKRPLGWSNGGSRVSYARNQSVQFRPQQR